jgi:cobalt-zinc-cadmium efflux system outer membrane protein
MTPMQLRQLLHFATFALLVSAIALVARAQAPSQMPLATPQGPVRITLDEAVQIALTHNHTLLAERTTINQNQAQEITANLRPNPVLTLDSQFIPIFSPQNLSGTYIDDVAQFDAGVSYLFERGDKRQRRLQAAKDQTAETRSTVADNERTLTNNVATQFINALLAESTLDLANSDLKGFQQTVDIGQEQYKAGDISEGDLLKIQLQLLQFQTDVSQARLARVQALTMLRQFLGYGSVPADYDVAGDLAYQAITVGKEDLQAMALRQRPDLLAAHQAVIAAKSQYDLAKANGKQDVTLTFDYDHVSASNNGSFFFNMNLPIFNRNQGEIARTNFVIDESVEQEKAASETVMSDVENAYEGLRTNNEVIQLYQNGYRDQATKSRDISKFAYEHGAASLLDFLDAERSYRAAELAYRQSLASYMMAMEQLREAVGTRTLP